MIAFDPMVSPFSVNMPYAVQMRVIAVVDLADDTGLGRLRIPARGEAEIDHLAVGLNGAPEVAPLSADANISFVDMPVETGPTQMLLGAPRQFWAELLDPAKDGRAINRSVALCQKIDDILIRQRVSQRPPDGTENDPTRKAMMFKR